jgi:hypothetical protein
MIKNIVYFSEDRNQLVIFNILYLNVKGFLKRLSRITVSIFVQINKGNLLFPKALFLFNFIRNKKEGKKFMFLFCTLCVLSGISEFSRSRKNFVNAKILTYFLFV